ncbi:hypothetical protein ACFXD5_41190 [Streptomyces sp. NPDC059385]|uniref:hypothetical protein n=1 Tax=Streptomyces sp. NPDC059385 TaxID=3346817 RepID=UPI0036B01F2B
MPSERTYWTDENGILVGKNKGSPGQTWTLTPWKRTPEESPNLLRAILLTGLFGPLGPALLDTTASATTTGITEAGRS